MQTPLRLGTRGSPLALAQAGMVARVLEQTHGLAPDAITIVPIRTGGDKVQDRPLAELGGKGVWTKELDRALLAGDIDFAVHSMKDVESVRPASIVIAAILPRADVRDRLIGAAAIDDLPRGARVGTSSPRRAAQLRRLRPDLEIVPFRGNVDTRLARLERGEADATLLAAAGLDRLGRDSVGSAVPIGTMLPAAAQAAIGIEARARDADLLAWLAAVGDRETERCIQAERTLLAKLGGDCRSPVAALATQGKTGIHLRAEIFSPDGALHAQGEALLNEPNEAARLAQRLFEAAPAALRAQFSG
ncbi:hydroxymethylbilane synthase [Sphingomonas flavalba]|uniref:hydroxymethylbilane synthase n=1 Tax=Sphingomonas flavalba TaxID=2559804 RepID=UPI0039DFE739